MARIVVALLLVVALTAVNADIWNEPPKKFVVGNTYTYRYDAQILTGIPTSSWHYTGYRLVCLVRLTLKDARTTELRLEQIQFLRMNRPINVDQPTLMLPLHYFEQMAEETVRTAIEKELRRPAVYRWTEGLVSHVQVDAKEQFWSINMKKGLLSMLHIDLYPYRHEDRTRSTGNFYMSRYEDGIEGVCRSAYHWNRLPVAISQPSSDSAPITMTKTRAHRDCLETPMFEHSLFMAQDCDSQRWNVTRDVVKAETTTSMNLTYWRNRQYFIWSIRTKSRYTFAPVHAKVGSISTFVRQNLTFLAESQNSAVSMTPPGRFISVPSLQMFVPIPEIMRTKNATGAITHRLFAILTQLRNALKAGNPDTLMLVKEWVALLRKAPKDLLVRLHKECANRAADFPEVFELFHDLLPAVATKEAVQVIVEKAILSPMVTAEQDAAVANRVRRLAYMNNVVYKDTILLLLDAAKSPVLMKKTHRRETLKAVLMTIGSLTKTYLDQKNLRYGDTAPQQPVTSDISEKVISFFEKLLEKDIPSLTKEEKTIVVCKAIGNTAIRKTSQIIWAYVHNARLPVSVRVQAIYSLHYLAVGYPVDIQQILLPVFFDTVQDAELRMASYLIVMKSRPSRVVLDSIVNSQLNEPVRQVKSFVLTHLQNIAEAPATTCERMTQLNVSRVMETVRVPDMGVQYSRSFAVPLWSRHNRAVLKTNWWWTPDDFLPRSFNMKVMMDTNSKRVNFFEIGARTDGAQDLLRRLLGPGGRAFRVNSLKELLKEFEPSRIATDNSFSFYTQVFGDEMGYWPLDKNLRDVLNEGFIGVTNNLMSVLTGKSGPIPFSLRKMLFLDGLIRVPTTFGLPFFANVTSMVYTNMGGSLRVVKGIQDREMIHVQLGVTPLMHSHHTVEAGIDATISKALSQVVVDANLPVKEKIAVNFQYVKVGPVGLRVHVEKPRRVWDMFEFRSDMRAVLMELRHDSTQWNIQAVTMPAKFFIRKDKAPQPVVSTIPIRFLGVNLELKWINDMPIQFCPDRIHSLLCGRRRMFVRLMNNDGQQDGAEFRVVTELASPMHGQTQFGSRKIIKFQLLRTNFAGRLAEVNPTISRTGLVGEISLTGGRVALGTCGFTIHLERFPMAQGEGWAFTYKGEARAPRQFTFDPRRPLAVLFNRQPNTFFRLEGRLVDKQGRTILTNRATLDMNEKALGYFTSISENIEAYRGLHPLVDRCASDIRLGLSNSPACFYTWRFVNSFNRFNGTIVLKHNAPEQFKVILSYLSSLRARPLRGHFDKVQVTVDDPDLDRRIRSGDLTYRVSLTTHPVHWHIGRLQFAWDMLVLRFRPVMLPAVFYTHMNPTDSLVTGTLRVFSNRRYPPTCMIRRNERTNRGQVMTFDAMTFAIDPVVPPTVTKLTSQTRRQVIAQDVNKTLQVSSVVLADGTIMNQVRTAKFGRIQVVRQQRKPAEIFVNGEKQQMPFVKTDSQGNVLIRIFHTPHNVYGLEGLINVEMPAAGVALRTDLATAMDVQVSPFFHGLMRGVCGDFDGETVAEVKTPRCDGFISPPAHVWSRAPYAEAIERSISLEEILRRDPFGWIATQPCVRGKRLRPMRIPVVTN